MVRIARVFSLGSVRLAIIRLLFEHHDIYARPTSVGHGGKSEGDFSQVSPRLHVPETHLYQELYASLSESHLSTSIPVTSMSRSFSFAPCPESGLKIKKKAESARGTFARSRREPL